MYRYDPHEKLSDKSIIPGTPGPAIIHQYEPHEVLSNKAIIRGTPYVSRNQSTTLSMNTNDSSFSVNEKNSKDSQSGMIGRILNTMKNGVDKMVGSLRQNLNSTTSQQQPPSIKYPRHFSGFESNEMEI